MAIYDRILARVLQTGIVITALSFCAYLTKFALLSTCVMHEEEGSSDEEEFKLGFQLPKRDNEDNKK